MRPKEHPDLVFDVIPKLYASTTKVFVTHLDQMEKQLKPPPQRFCRMYTTRPLANQLLRYLQSQRVDISEKDFHITEDFEPFQLRLSDGRRLEAMLCAGTALGSSLMLLIRKIQGGKLLYFYSAVQQDDLCQVIKNPVFIEWIAQGTDRLFLNLTGADRPFVHVDYDDVQADIETLRKENNNVVCLKLPLFGYEPLVRQLGHTALYGHIRLMAKYAESYASLGSDMQRFEEPDYVAKVHVFASNDSDVLTSQRRDIFALGSLRWSPQPTRINLIQLCSLLRPEHIQGIVPHHSTGNVPPAPEYLQRFKASYLPHRSSTLGPGSSAQRKAVAPSGKKVDHVVKRKGCEFLSDDDDDDDADQTVNDE